MEINDITNLVAKIDSGLSDNEGKLLYQFARNCAGNGVIVEIGSWMGRSTIWIGKGASQSNSKIYAIDPHYENTFEEFQKNIRMANIDKQVISLVKTSVEAVLDVSEPVEFIFIDGGHRYDLVKQDFDLWFPNLIEGGIIAFHDVRGWSGPRKVFREDICKSKYFVDIGLCDTIGFACKVRKNSNVDRLRGRYILLLTYVFDLGNWLRRFKFLKPLSQLGKKVVNTFSISSKYTII